MQNVTEQQLLAIKRQLNEGQDAGLCIAKLSPLLYQMADASLLERFEKVQENYRLIIDFMLQGYSDPQREQLYQKLLISLYHIISDALHVYLNTTNGSFSVLWNTIKGISPGADCIKTDLEGFVSDLALVDLVSENLRSGKLRTLHIAHQKNITQVFNVLFTSSQWLKGEADSYADLILSPTIDVMDAMVMVSAVMLSAIEVFDINKLNMLYAVFAKATDERLRQRALVGLALGLQPQELLFLGEQQHLVQLLCAKEADRKELMELQQQLVYCLNAVNDNQKIQSDIMPTIIKNRNWDITKYGISDKDENAIEDIIHPEVSEKAMDEIENAMHKIGDMEKAGSDVYFGGFQYMKRFAFFHTLVNWFMPFSVDHPDLRTDKIKSYTFLKTLFSKGPFCDSDKYSFAIGIDGFIEKLPPEVREMMTVGDGVVGPSGSIDYNSSAYIRRMYLQDLYRFFMLYQDKHNFTNPLIDRENPDEPNIFVSTEVFANTELQQDGLKLLSLFKRIGSHFPHATQAILSHYPNQYAIEFLLSKGYTLFNENRPECLEYFRKAHVLDGLNNNVLRALAKAELLYGEPNHAVSFYTELLKRTPDSTNALLNLCVAQIKMGKADEALTNLYKIDYEHGGDSNVTRVLAWALLNLKKYEQAEAEYAKLLQSERSTPEDYLNCGYSLWLMGRIEKAISLFRKYQSLGKTLPKAFEEDRQFLFKMGLTRTGITLMLNAISAS